MGEQLILLRSAIAKIVKAAGQNRGIGRTKQKPFRLKPFLGK